MGANGGAALAIIGHPNVGKSALFQQLTGQRVFVANYPGTTVGISRAAARELPETVVLDTPGVVTLPSHSEDEHVTSLVLLQEPLKAILQVGDAKNPRRTLLLTVQLAEMGLPLVLALNMKDEAQQVGVEVDYGLLSEHLSVPIVPTTATRGEGLPELLRAVGTARIPQFRLAYPSAIEQALAEIATRLPEATISRRALALMWFCEDVVVDAWLRSRLDSAARLDLRAHREKLQLSFVKPLLAVIQDTRLRFVQQIVAETSRDTGRGWRGLQAALGRLSMHPFWGWPILVGVLTALYWFVGVFGAGILVDLLEGRLFGEVINPWFAGWVQQLIPIPFLVDLLVGPFGLWTIGMTYALALILPIVSTFFLAFGILEDSGYLPRLVALSNRVFQALGLNGKAVLPMVLGLGCVTMATLTTRVLESRRERVLATLLLALAVPCSAQLGVVMGMLAGISLTAAMIWGGVVGAVLLLVGWLAARLVPGERSPLLVELPPMRWPQLSNVVIKTLARLEWYLKEVVPLFLIGAAVMFALDRMGLLAWLAGATEPLVVSWLGLPAEASTAFLMGFLRRDFGATGLFIMETQGLLAPVQVVVAMVAITLFIPCVASVLIIAKEHGRRMAAGMVVLIFPLAFLVAGLLQRLLTMLGWGS